MDLSFKRFAFLLGLFFLLGFSAYSQTNNKTFPNSYVINGVFDEQKLSFYNQSIEASNFEQYRLRDESVMLNFKNGFTLELISAKDLTVKNKLQNVNPNLYQEKNSVPVGYVYPTFEIIDSGMILAAYQAKEVKVKKP